MNNTLSLKDHKHKKICEKVIKDINAILLVLSLTQRGLTVFKHYISIQEIISVVETNKTLLDLQLKKYEKELKAIKDANEN